jgi:hypothetical protein
MHSDGKPKNLNSSSSLSARPPPQWGGWQRYAVETPEMAAELLFAQTRQVRLAEEHRDLDQMITLLSGRITVDETLIARLKKRKLSIKDEIVRIEVMLAGAASAARLAERL